MVAYSTRFLGRTLLNCGRFICFGVCVVDKVLVIILLCSGEIRYVVSPVSVTTILMFLLDCADLASCVSVSSSANFCAETTLKSSGLTESLVCPD